MVWAIPITALATAGGLEWTKWGQGAWNWGPRIGALLLVLVGDVAFRATLAGDWLRRGIDAVAHWVDLAVTYVLGAGAGNAAGALVHWLPAALIAIYWIVAWSPWGAERMTWRLAWTGLLLPTFISAIPGFAGSVIAFMFGLATAAGTALITGMFAAGGAVLP